MKKRAKKRSFSMPKMIQESWTYLFARLNWTQVSLLMIGALAFITVLLALFFSYGDSTPYLKTTGIYPVDSADFLQAISRLSNSPVGQGGDIKILNNGDEFLPELLSTLKSARHTINFSAYVWKKGSMSDQVLAVLMERAHAGVQVRLLLDGIGGSGAPDNKIDELAKAGGIIDTF